MLGRFKETEEIYPPAKAIRNSDRKSFRGEKGEEPLSEDSRRAFMGRKVIEEPPWVLR